MMASPLEIGGFFGKVNDELPGHCAEAVRVPKPIQGACGLCKRGKNEIFMNGLVNQNTRKTLQFFPCLGEKIFTGRFSDVKQNGFRPSKWQCKQNGSQTAVFATVPSFGYLKALLAPRHAWCSSSNVLLLHGLFVGFLGFNPGRKHLSWMSVMMYKGGTAHPLERPKLQSYAVWPCPETWQVLRQITWQIKQVFEFWLVGRRNQLDSSYFDPQSFIDCDMQCYTTWWRLLRLCDQWSELGTRCIRATWWFGGGSAWFSFRSEGGRP